jgi:hypothetical protein
MIRRSGSMADDIPFLDFLDWLHGMKEIPGIEEKHPHLAAIKEWYDDSPSAEELIVRNRMAYDRRRKYKLSAVRKK